MIKGLVINDLHFGHKESKRMYDELHQFTDKINEVKPNLLVIDGDFWDHKIDATDPSIFYGLSFFNEVFRLCKKYHTVFRMVQGTRSHELNQLQLFKPNELDPEIDFKIIETVQEEDLYGLHVLYLPEEYPENAEEYYAPYKAERKEYNIIFGHGTWDFVAFKNQIAISNMSTHTAPVFIWDEWKHTVPHGFVTFGHIHGRNTYRNKIFYSGSFTRWNFGERSEKGFTYFEYDLDKQDYKVEYINNTEAPKYEVMEMSDIRDYKTMDIVALKKSLDEWVDGKNHIRMDLAGLDSDKADIIRKYYASNPTVQIEYDRSKALLNESKKEPEEDFSKWHYITKRELPLNKMIQKYCKEEMKKDLTIESIDKVLKED